MTAAFDHPFLSGLLGDEEMAALIGVDAEIAEMLQFEAALAGAEAENGLIPAAAAQTIAGTLATFRPDMEALKAGTARDGVVVPELVRQIRQAVGEPHAQHVHFGATSQDVVDTALVLRARACLVLLEQRLQALVAAFADLGQKFGGRQMMGYTRMQAALPITVADRIASWRAPLARHLERLETLRRSLLVVQFGGPAGTLDKLDGKGSAVRAALAARLGLGDAPQWHAQRDRVADLANWLSLVTGSLGKFGQDVTLMAQAGSEIELAGGGTSSALAHKQNPVDAEVLIALARFNAVQLAGIHQALVHEQERSGAAWTLEWMILPPMLIATAASTRGTGNLIKNITAVGR